MITWPLSLLSATTGSPRFPAPLGPIVYTSIIKTILLRFCSKADGSIPDLGKRVTSANHLGHALTEPMPRPSPPKESYEGIVAAFASWHRERFAARFQPDRVRTNQVHELNEFQRGLIRAAKRLPPKQQKEFSQLLPPTVKSSPS
jgi:hypothetical protein